jgi:hypothetical protein
MAFEFFSTEVRTSKLKVISHGPLMQKLLMPKASPATASIFSLGPQMLNLVIYGRLYI